MPWKRLFLMADNITFLCVMVIVQGPTVHKQCHCMQVDVTEMPWGQLFLMANSITQLIVRMELCTVRAAHNWCHCVQVEITEMPWAQLFLMANSITLLCVMVKVQGPGIDAKIMADLPAKLLWMLQIREETTRRNLQDYPLEHEDFQVALHHAMRTLFHLGLNSSGKTKVLESFTPESISSAVLVALSMLEDPRSDEDDVDTAQGEVNLGQHPLSC